MEKSLLLHVSATVIWKKEERSRVMAIKMDNLRGLFGIRKMDKGFVQSEEIRLTKRLIRVFIL